MFTASKDSRADFDGGLFNQIALFSAAGLAMSLTLVVIGGLQIAYSWV
jgi:hypothetical protein